MELLLLFAFISGLVTIFAPCIWPILPIILSASTSGGHKKPLGITLGIIISFAVITLSISYIIKIFPFDPEVLRYFAVAIIGFLGLTLILPALSQKLEGVVSRLSGKLGMVSNPQKNGFWSGFITGFALGIVWTPCAGPILATIATLAATQAVNLNVILVTVAYVIGVGIPLFLFASAGSALFTKSRFLSKYTGRIQQVFGVIMILTAVAIATNYDKTLQVKLLDAFPRYSGFVNQLESNDTVKEQLNTLKGKQSPKSKQSSSKTVDTNEFFNENKPAPEFTGLTTWHNTEKPITLKEQRGKVVLVDFWTYTCINCIRTLPHVAKWYEKYKDQGFVVIGIHSPGFAFEKDEKNVVDAIKRFNLNFPIAQDNDFSTWDTYDNEFWPAEYLIDANGNIRRTHFGEGGYEKTEEAIQVLLKEAGQQVNNAVEKAPDRIRPDGLSRETHLGSLRMRFHYPSANLTNGKHSLKPIDDVPHNSFSLGGDWTVTEEYASAGKNATLNYKFTGNKVFFVLRAGSTNQTATVKVYLDGKIVDQKDAGEDVINGIVTVNDERLYRLIDLKGTLGDHTLKLEFQTPGTEGFEITFG